jgi:quercetin 2,3-dioxygenase
MSNLVDARFDALATRSAEIAPGFFVHRALPSRGRRTIGAWCFLDHYGPVAIGESGGMRVAAHPHIGLQTVTWLFEGTALHRDSLGSEQLIEPGQLNLMTSGRGIAHAEFSPADAPPHLHGVQLWVALPAAHRNVEPSFEHHAELPKTRVGAVEATVLTGAFADTRSTARAFSPIVGAELRFIEDGSAEIPLNPDFEHGIIRIEGTVRSAGRTMDAETLYDLGAGGDVLQLEGRRDARLLLIGGAPFGEKLIMWWNFVARTPDEIARAREDWTSGKFGTVENGGDPIPAPPLAVGLRES